MPADILYLMVNYKKDDDVDLVDILRRLEIIPPACMESFAKEKVRGMEFPLVE